MPEETIAAHQPSGDFKRLQDLQGTGAKRCLHNALSKSICVSKMFG